MSQTTAIPDVLTLDEAARYLRLAVETVEKLAVHGGLPGRRIDEDWRFSKLALEGWLQGLDPRNVLLQQAGSFAEDPSLAELRATIYAERGRPFEKG